MWEARKSIILMAIVTATIVLSGCIDVLDLAPDMSKTSLVPNMMPGQPTLVVPGKTAVVTTPGATPIVTPSDVVPDGAPWYVGRYALTSTGVIIISDGVPSGTISPDDMGNRDIVLNFDGTCTSAGTGCTYVVTDDRLIMTGRGYSANYSLLDDKIINDTNLGYNNVMVWTKV